MNSKRNLPSWMSSKEDGSKPHRKKQVDAGEEVTDHGKGCGSSHSNDNSQSTSRFSKLMEGVKFVLSGFVNPERSTLRSQGLEMGAEYQPDWTSNCTLLVCAFPNTPKFRQVQSENGTIVSKEWISECYKQKKLVDIEPYLMHAGKPWRESNKTLETNKDKKNVVPEEPRKQVDRRPHVLLTGPAISEGGFSPSKVKEWATDDLRETMSWLQSQDEKPEPNEVKNIAAEGIITCLLDAIESLKQNHDIHLVTEQWKFVPRVVKELTRLEGRRGKKGSLSREELFELATNCKEIYESEFDSIDNSPLKKQKAGKGGDDVNEETGIMSEDAGFDSDQTIEMTEEEINIACKQLSEHCE